MMAMWICSECGWVNHNQYGAPTWTCRKCGYKVDDKMRVYWQQYVDAPPSLPPVCPYLNPRELC